MVGGDDGAGAVFGIAHGPVGDVLAGCVHGGAIHVEGGEDALFYKLGVRLMGGPLDDEGQKAETGVAVLEFAPGRKIGAVVC